MQTTKSQISKVRVRKLPVLSYSSKTLTFDFLLKKYKGKIMQADGSELQRVKPNGLQELFAALRRYRENEKHLRECKCCSSKPNLTS